MDVIGVIKRSTLRWSIQTMEHTFLVTSLTVTANSVLFKTLSLPKHILHKTIRLYSYYLKSKIFELQKKINNGPDMSKEYNIYNMW